MAKTRSQKEQSVASLVQVLTHAKGLAFARLAQHSVSDDTALRRAARTLGVQLGVTKKTLLARAASQAGIAVNPTGFTGTTVMATSNDDEVTPAKLLYTFGQTHPGVVLVGAFASGVVLSEVDAVRFAQLPGITELRGQLTSVIAGPLRGLVTVLAGPLRGLATVLTRRAESLPSSS